MKPLSDFKAITGYLQNRSKRKTKMYKTEYFSLTITFICSVKKNWGEKAEK